MRAHVEGAFPLLQKIITVNSTSRGSAEIVWQTPANWPKRSRKTRTRQIVTQIWSSLGSANESDSVPMRDVLEVVHAHHMQTGTSCVGWGYEFILKFHDEIADSVQSLSDPSLTRLAQELRVRHRHAPPAQRENDARSIGHEKVVRG
jgi:hypothetical protein